MGPGYILVRDDVTESQKNEGQEKRGRQRKHLGLEFLSGIVNQVINHTKFQGKAPLFLGNEPIAMKAFKMFHV